MPKNNILQLDFAHKGTILNWAGTYFRSIYKSVQVGTLVLWHLLKQGYQFPTALLCRSAICSCQWISCVYICSHKSQLTALIWIAAALQFWSFVVLPWDVRFYTNSCTVFLVRQGGYQSWSQIKNQPQCWLLSVLLVLQAKRLYIFDVIKWQSQEWQACS